MANGRCRLHGGRSTGAPTGKDNGNYKHGRRTLENIEFKRYIRSLRGEAAQNNAMCRSWWGQLRGAAHALGLTAPKLFRLCLINDGRLELLVIRRLESNPDLLQDERLHVGE
jgi:hypothetical protein